MTLSGTLAGMLALLGAVAPTARWIGQDGQDFTSTSPELKPNAYQDIHVALIGLPTERAIAKIDLLGDGGGAWGYQSNPNAWRIAVVRPPHSPSAELYFESGGVERGRTFFLNVFFDDGSKAEIHVRGGPSNPNLRMPKAVPVVKWVGQDRKDWTGPGAAVGPDLIQDVRLSLSNLDSKEELRTAELEGPGGLRWHFGINPKGYANAELVRDGKDPTTADFFFQPERDLAGAALRLTLNYATGKTDSLPIVARAIDPALRMPALALPTAVATAITARWLGQDRGAGGRPGDVHLAISGLPVNRDVAFAVLSDSMGEPWAYQRSDRVKHDAGPSALPMRFKRGSDPTTADLYFAPERDESGTMLTLRFVFVKGDIAIASIAGGSCKPAATPVAPAATTIVARPGDDLNALAERFGTITLSAGTYPLAQPLVLKRPVTLVGQRNAIVRFTQGANDSPWPAALKIHSGGTTLRGFSVRFSGPIRWRNDVSYGPAVIGTTDNTDSGPSESKTGLTFDRLDVETPPAAHPAAWEEAPRIIRLVNARGGKVTDCVLRGGSIEFFSGPWEITGNEYRGTVPGTFTHGVAAGHDVHDLLVRGNRVKPVGPSGKTWRFLVLTSRGRRVRIENNRVEGVGPRDDDTIPNMNAPEIVLTESYRINFEGKLSAVSPDGRLVRVAMTQGEPPSVGSVVAILAGPHAGRWCVIAQIINPTTYLLETPLPRGAEQVSITAGFFKLVFEGNTIDARGGSGTSSLVLSGNHFGTVVRDNRFLGGGEVFRINACTTELPRIWGWSHAPYFGGLVEGNLLEDSERGGILGVEHSVHIKTNRGRVYQTMILRKNQFRWTEAFLEARERSKVKTPPIGISIGYQPSLDPGELILTEDADALQAPDGFRQGDTLKVTAAWMNGRRTVNQGLTLPQSPPVSRVSRATKP